MVGKDEHIYGFSKPSADALLQSIGAGKTPGAGTSIASSGYIIKTPSGGIPKKVGTTVTMVDCDVFYLAGTGSTRTVTDAGFKVPVGNFSSTADIAGNREILPTMHGGALLANYEDC